MALTPSQLTAGQTPSEFDEFPYFNREPDFKRFDPLEYCMGMNRGDLYEDNITTTVRLKMQKNLVDPFPKGYWALIPNEDVLEALRDLWLSNLNSRNSRRKKWDTVPELTAETYSYTLFYDEERINITDMEGRQCQTGVTTIQAKLHPCFTICAAGRFFRSIGKTRKLVHRTECKRPALTCLGIEMFLQRSYPLSFFAYDRSLDYRPYPSWYNDIKPIAKTEDEDNELVS